MKISFLTLGCKVNFYETEKMMEQFRQQGFQIVKPEEAADVFVINTCTVTNMADRKSRQMIHRGKKNNPDCLVVAAGCYADSDGDKLRADKSIDLVVGNEKKSQIVELVLAHLDTSQGRDEAVEDNSESVIHERTRAFIQIQNGCNQFCSYCIIPFVRGRLKSREEADVVEEVTQLAKKGYKEVVLTGIHLSSYGVDKSECKNFVELEGQPLLSLMKKIDAIDGIERIRLGSLEPRIITGKFLQGLGEIGGFCPHFHLSLQSGCDETLLRMNRKYSTKEYEDKCNMIRHTFDKPAITTDVIVGFPGETKEEFGKTMAYLGRIRLADIHVFKYSVRSGTKAAGMENQVPEQVKTSRSNELIAKASEWTAQYNEQFMGLDEDVLMEEIVVREGKEYLMGHTKRYVKVAVPLEEAKEKGYKENEIISLRVNCILKK